MRVMIIVVCLASTFMTATRVAHGQAVMAGDEIFIEMLKLDVQQAKTDVIANVMQFSAGDAAKFWPIYEGYQERLGKLGAQRIELIKEYAGAYWSLTDSQARDMAGRWFDFQQQRVELYKEFYDAVAKDLSPTIGMKALQVEHRLNLLIDLQVANELPMLE